MNDDVLLAGRRPGDGDGVKVRYFPETKHIKISFLSRSGREVHSFEVDGIADLRELNHIIQRAVARYEELYPAQKTYLTNIRKILSPQTDSHATALINAKP